MPSSEMPVASAVDWDGAGRKRDRRYLPVTAVPAHGGASWFAFLVDCAGCWSDRMFAGAYTILAHPHETEWAASYGVVEELIRISIGLESEDWLKARVQAALDAASRVD